MGHTWSLASETLGHSEPSDAKINWDIPLTELGSAAVLFLPLGSLCLLGCDWAGLWLRAVA